MALVKKNAEILGHKVSPIYLEKPFHLNRQLAFFRCKPLLLERDTQRALEIFIGN